MNKLSLSEWITADDETRNDYLERDRETECGYQVGPGADLPRDR